MHKIAITQLSNNWKSLLNQFGVDYCEITEFSQNSLNDISAIIITSALNKTELESINTFVQEGGAVLDCFYQYTKTKNSKIRVKKLRTIIINDNIYSGLIDVNSQNHQIFSENSNSWKNYLIKKHGKGISAFLGLKPDVIFSNTDSKRYKFLSNKKRHPEEEISTISKGAVSSIIFNLLKEIHVQRKQLFIHKWFFPGSEKNIFLFREDTDYCSKSDIQKIQNVSKANSTKITWFIHCKENESFLEDYKNNVKDEIGLHCFDHFTSSNTDNIRDDIDKAISTLQKCKIQPDGYAAPYGQWNKNLSRVLSEMDFSYSSEFSILYDSLPIRLTTTDNILQIPIHPICIDSLIKSGKNDDEIINYYKDVIDRAISLQIPVALYDHPGHDRYHILNVVFEYVNSLSLKSFTFREYSDWWQEREMIKIKTTFNSSKIIDSKVSKDHNICIWKDSKEYTIIENGGSYNINNLRFEKIISSNTLDVKRLKSIRKIDLNMLKRSYLAKWFWRNKK